MKPTYRANFALGTKQAVTLDGVLDTLHSWLRRKAPHLTRAMLEGATNEDRALRAESVIANNGKLYGLRVTHPDARDYQFLWQTDIALDLQGTIAELSIEMANGWSDRRVAPKTTEPSRPNIVPLLIEKYGAQLQHNPLSTNAFVLDDSNIKLLPALVFAPERILPIVYVSRTNTRNELPISPDQIAHQLAGIAHVMASSDNHHGEWLKTAMGKQMSAYNGTVRLYWPIQRIAAMRNPKHHQYWPDVSKQDPIAFTAMLLKHISEHSIGRAPSISYGDVKRASILESAHDPVAYALAEQYAQEAAGLRQQSTDLQNRILIYEAEATDRNEQIVQLRQQVQRRPDTRAPITTPLAAVERFITERGDYPVHFMKRAVRAARNCHFTQPELIYQSLEWLADVYQPSKSGNMNADLLQSAREQLGATYAPNQAMTTMRAYEEEYRIEHDGKKFWLENHLRFGRTHDPRHTLRVAFTFDDRDKSVLVGYIGNHQTNTRT